MTVEKIDTHSDDFRIDPNMEIRTLTYTIAELQGGTPGCVISQPHAVRYFEKENSELVVKQIYSFRMNQTDQTVILKIRVAKRGPTPITDPARLLNAGPEIPLDCVDKDGLRLRILEDEISEKDIRIQELEKQLDVLIREEVGKELGGALKIVELEKENAILKSAIEKFGNSDDFDWNVLGRIDGLETAIKYAITDLPESPDSAKAYLLHVLAPSKNPKASEQNGTS